MVRANIKGPDDQYIGVIDEEAGGFRIVWIRNEDYLPVYARPEHDVLYPTFADACAGALAQQRDADIVETIYFKGPLTCNRSKV